MFTQECFIRNVGEKKFSLIVELERLGYKPMYMVMKNNLGGSNLVCEFQTWHCTDSDNKPDAIDCGTNEDLFLALAALRSETSKLQWFVCDKVKKGSGGNLDKVGNWFKWINGFEPEVGDMLGIYYHKATVEEIIEHFS